jgi:hypothetical protein
MLRRRTDSLLWLVLGTALLAGLVGTALAVWRAPGTSAWLSAAATGAAVATCAALDEYGWMFVALAAIYSVLALGLYALWLVGVSVAAVLAIAGALAVLVIVMLARALLAAGSADYPYDDQ